MFSLFRPGAKRHRLDIQARCESTPIAANLDSNNPDALRHARQIHQRRHDSAARAPRIAARVSANGTLARRELARSLSFCASLFSASSDEAALVLALSRIALGARVAPGRSTMASVLEVLPSLSCAWLIPDRVRRFSADIPAGPVTVRLQLDLVKALEDERNEAPEASFFGTCVVRFEFSR